MGFINIMHAHTHARAHAERCNTYATAIAYTYAHAQLASAGTRDHALALVKSHINLRRMRAARRFTHSIRAPFQASARRNMTIFTRRWSRLLSCHNYAQSAHALGRCAATRRVEHRPLVSHDIILYACTCVRAYALTLAGICSRE